MATYHYTLPWTVLDVGNNSLVLNRSDGILLDDQGNEHPVTTPAGVPANVSTGPSGVTAPFHAQIPYGRVRFGGVEAAVFSIESMSALETATQAAADAASMRATVEAIAATASEIAYFYRDTEGDIWVTGEPVLVGGGVPRLDANGDPVVLFL